MFLPAVEIPRSSSNNHPSSVLFHSNLKVKSITQSRLNDGASEDNWAREIQA